MTNNIRVFLWLGLGLALWVNYSQWQVDYGAKATAPTTTGAPDAPKPPSLDDTVPHDVVRFAAGGGCVPPHAIVDTDERGVFRRNRELVDIPAGVAVSPDYVPPEITFKLVDRQGGQ